MKEEEEKKVVWKEWMAQLLCEAVNSESVVFVNCEVVGKEGRYNLTYHRK